MIRSGPGEPLLSPVSAAPAVLSFNPSSTGHRLASTGDAAQPPAAHATVGRRERRRIEVFERLLTAARDVIMSRGLDRATVKDITDAADVGKGTFFLHFRSKEHVVPALIEREGLIFERALDRARAGESVVALLAALFGASQTAASLDHTMFFRSHLLAAIARADVRDLAIRSLSANSERIQALLMLGQERGEIRRDCAAADLARLTQQVGLGARLLAMWGEIDPSTDYMTSSRQLVLALLQPVPVTVPARLGPPPEPAEGGQAASVATRRRTRRI